LSKKSENFIKTKEKDGEEREFIGVEGNLRAKGSLRRDWDLKKVYKMGKKNLGPSKNVL
jgi:hypothetical protein